MDEKTRSQARFERYIEQGFFKCFEIYGICLFNMELEKSRIYLSNLDYENFGYEITEISKSVDKKLEEYVKKEIKDSISIPLIRISSLKAGIETLLFSHAIDLIDYDLDFPELSRIIMSDYDYLCHSESFYNNFKETRLGIK
jgi:hypothetical protein